MIQYVKSNDGVRICRYCWLEIFKGLPYTTFEDKDYHLSCFAKYEDTELRKQEQP